MSPRIYLLDTSVILPLVRGNALGNLWLAACAKAAGATLPTTDNDFMHLILDHLDGEVIDPAVVHPRDSE